MFAPDINVIRAVQSDRIRRDLSERHDDALPPRPSALRAVRRSIGHSIVRLGARIASEPASEQALDLAGS